MNRKNAACFHCGADVPEEIHLEEIRAGQVLQFCCRGCLGAFLLISGAGLGDFYRRRDWPVPGIGKDAYRTNFKDSQLSRFVYCADDQSAIDIIIDGIRCTTCVWLNEKIIGKLPGVTDVRVNYATSRARVRFRPDEITPAGIFTRIGELGYIPRPYTSSAAEESANRERKDLLVRFGTALFLTMQLMAYSIALYAGYMQGIGHEIKIYLQYFSLLVTTPVIFYSGWPFIRGAWRGILNRAPNMELLIAIGALSSYGYSVYAIISGEEVYFETAAMIITLILAGRLLENAAKRRAAGGVERLLGMTRGESKRVIGDQIETVDSEVLQVGDQVIVGPGERFPVDGKILEGVTDVDESPATGEAIPVEKRRGSYVIGGSINLTGGVRVLCESQADGSFIARVARLVEEAQSRKAPIQGIADRVAVIFVPAVLVLSLMTFIWEYLTIGQFSHALMTSLAVVVIACPCALGLATPTAIIAGTGAAAASGIIFKGGDILERLSRISIAVFDKTGTITWGQPEVIAIHTAEGTDVEKMIFLAAAVESSSLHPIGRAICDYARSKNIRFAPGENLRAVAGGGVTGDADNKVVAVGSASFLAELKVAGLPDAELIDFESGDTAVLIAGSGRYLGLMVLRDRLREDAPSLVAYFQKKNIRSIMLSGDRKETACLAARKVGIVEGLGEMSPADKIRFIERLQERGELVLMVGDGINDAAALSAADVGCAVAGGTDIALETSDVVLTKPGLAKISVAHRVASRTMSIVRQNLGWAFIYNIIGIPLAMTGRLTPIYAAAAMALSSLCVVGNSLRITRINNG